jgi:hypothetical protein
MDDQILRNKLEVVEYLQRRGFKIAKSKLYADAKKGLLRVQADDSVYAGDAEAYARQMNLPRPDMDGPDPAQVEAAQLEKSELEKREFEPEQEQGKYIPKDQLALELASRAGVLDSGLRAKIKERDRDLVHTAGGKPERVPEFVAQMMEILDEQMNEFCRMDRFQVVFEDTEEVENAD